MTLKEHIDDIRDNLEQGLFTNEAAVSNGIVRRLLDALDWPIYNPQVIIPEYPVEGGRVDYALCHPPLKPVVFIEVKQVGNIEGAERQLFEYAFHKGVPIAILTDGREWRFFHPIAQGDYRERRVRELNLSKDNSEESAGCLNRYLNYESIHTGKAVEAIKEDYQRFSKQKEIERRLPEVWNELIEEKNEELLLIVTKKTTHKVGYGPTEGQVLDFLKSLERKSESIPREIPLHQHHQNPAGATSSMLKSEESFIVLGRKRTVNAAQIQEMQAKYKETGVLKNSTQLLVDWKIILPSEKNAAWAFVKKITGHVSQSRKSS